jgi:hypothetical protein
MVDVPLGDDFVHDNIAMIKQDLYFHLLPPLCEIIESYLDTLFFIISSEGKRIPARRSEIGVCHSFQKKLQNDPLGWKQEDINLTTIELAHLTLFLHSLALGDKATELPRPLGDTLFGLLQPWEMEFLTIVLEGKPGEEIVPAAFHRKKECIFHLMIFAKDEKLPLLYLFAALTAWAAKAMPLEDQMEFLKSLP